METGKEMGCSAVRFAEIRDSSENGSDCVDPLPVAAAGFKLFQSLDQKARDDDG
jgi:hypothetical protein